MSVNSVNRLFFASVAGSTFNSIDELQILNNNQFNSNISVYACGKTGIFDNTFNYLESVSAKLSQTRKNLLCNNTFNNKIYYSKMVALHQVLGPHILTIQQEDL